MKNDALLNEISLPKESSIRDAITSLNASGKGIVLLYDEQGKLSGTITDADVRRGLSQGFGLEDDCCAIACLKPIAIDNGTVKADVFKKFRDTKLRALPVVLNDGYLVDCSFLDQFQPEEYNQKILMIMAGGFGKRMGELTKDTPKPMLLVRGKPMIQYIVERAAKENFEQVFISTHYLKNRISDYFEDGKAFGVSIQYIEEKVPLGTGGSFSILPVNHGPVVVTNTDVMTNLGYSKLLDFHRLHNAEITMAVRRHLIQHPYGVVKGDGLDFIGIEEKPVWSTDVNAGIYVLDMSVRDIVGAGDVISMPEIVTRAQQHGKKVILFPLHEECIDLGTIAEYRDMR